MSDQKNTIETQTTYRVVRGSLRVPRKATTRTFVNRGDFVNQGELIPAGMFSESDIQGWLTDGRIERADVSPNQVMEAERVRSRGKWTVDPSALAGKTMEDMTMMILDIDADYDVASVADAQEAVRLLTSDWSPAYAQMVQAARDRSRPEALVLSKLEQTLTGKATSSSSRDLSPAAQEALAAARAKAKAPKPDAEASAE